MSQGKLTQIVRTTDPSPAPSGFVTLYNKNGQYFFINDVGTVTPIPLDTEAVQDIVGGLIIGGTGIDAVYDDPAGTLTISVDSATLSIINNALQSGDNVSELVNDADYHTGSEVASDISAAIATHEAESDPHPQYTTTAEAALAAPVQSVNGETGVLTDYAKTDITNTFVASQNIKTSSGSAVLDIDADNGDAGINLRSGSNLWGIFGNDGADELYIGTNNGPGIGEEFVISTTEIDAKTKRIRNVVDPSLAQDAATKGYVDTEIAAVDHDQLTNFVANEHIDWTAPGAGTIDSSNLPATSPVFGSEFEQFLDTSNVSFTTNTPFEAYDFLVTKPAGLYRISVNFHYEPSNTGTNDIFSLRVDSTQIGLEFADEGKDTGSDIRRIVTLVGYYNNPSTSSFEIELWGSQEGSGTTVIHGCAAEIWRVS